MTKKRAHRRGSSMIQYTLSRASGERTERFAAPRCDRRTGDPGPAGDTATIAVGTTTTGAPGTAARVVAVGTSAAQIFDFTIPRRAVTPECLGQLGLRATPACLGLRRRWTLERPRPEQRARSARHTKWHVIGAYLQLHDSNRHAGRSGRA
jgi:hypothetical protein